MAKLLSSLPIGTKVKEANTKYYGQPIVFQMIDVNHAGYPANSITLLTDKSIMLKSFDAKEASNPDTNRQNYGNNRYLHSNLRQWMNKEVNPWYAAQHSYDTPPNATNVNSGWNDYEAEAGFLSNFSAEMKAKLLLTTLTVAKNTVTDGGGSETVQDKVFFLSNTEVGLANENGVVEGSLFSIFNSDTARLAKPTAEAVANSEYTSTSLTANDPWHWWLRTPYAGYSNNARVVNSSGSLSNTIAYYGHFGVRPALNLSSDIMVSDTADANGVYTIEWNQAPVISGQDADLGAQPSPLQQDYSVTEPDGDTFSIVEKVNGSVLRSINGATSGATYTLDLTSIWGDLALGSHVATITATDSKNASAERTYTFEKTNQSADAPLMVFPLTNMRTNTDPYARFTIGSDYEGDSQTFKAQVADDSGFSQGLVEITTGFELNQGGVWEPLTEATNIDAGKEARVQLPTLTLNTEKFLRVGAVDSGSLSTSWSTVQKFRVGDILEVTTDPFAADYRPARLNVIDKKVIDQNIEEMKVYACNNALDAAPTWEDITVEYNSGDEYLFINETKTAAQWAVSVKYYVKAGTATGEISISAHGGGLT